MLRRSIGFADRMQEIECIVIRIAYHIEPPMSLKGQFDTALMDDALPHLGLRQSFYLRTTRQSGTFAHLVKRFLRFCGAA